MSTPEVEECVEHAIRSGYRMVDTAQVYRNERYVGEALKNCENKHGIDRHDIFLISKLHPKNNGEKAYESVKESLKALEVDYIDLFLIHWPGKTKYRASDKRNEQARELAWRGLERAYDEGLVRAIGVSNYEVSHLNHLLSFCKVHPAVNQCEFHPLYRPFDVIQWCQKNNVHFQAYSSLGTSDSKALLSNDKMLNMAKELDCTVGQLLLAYALNQGISVLPKSTRFEHIEENLKAKEVKLSQDQLREMEIMSEKKLCWDPSKVC
ncbi:unnamed protein product [Bursaphelenchus okinawaensis]|uniref:NADP-dependent oxidoreductase domain-containing protein n=1 Tax=Bursaphelenchus okinawaensis TaxID=465554 RepID=A0A811KT12_9BILA|nr:unnamed protein product [Bursaphelenchus okinawaensis]CAG9112798.1 unnamed protein product [Bursaphelenchus okinawaensis]